MSLSFCVIAVRSLKFIELKSSLISGVMGSVAVVLVVGRGGAFVWPIGGGELGTTVFVDVQADVARMSIDRMNGIDFIEAPFVFG
ncbi:MAG: hypothetical protein ACNI27_15160 [Desulfovibrio sp.]